MKSFFIFSIFSLVIIFPLTSHSEDELLNYTYSQAFKECSEINQGTKKINALKMCMKSRGFIVDETAFVPDPEDVENSTTEEDKVSLKR